MDLYFGKPDYTPEQVPLRMKDFVFDQYHLVVGEKCIKFMDALYAHDYEMDYHYAHDRESATKEQVATAGLALMFNTKWLTEPAFVDWKEMSYVVFLMDMGTLKDYFVLNKFIELIEDPKIKIAIIKHLLKFYFPRNRDLKLLMERELIAANNQETERRHTPNINIGTQTNYIGCTIQNGQQTDIPSSVSTAPEADPAPSDNIPDSIIFTKKAKKEAKEATILDALQKSVQGRKDKTRAFVEELHGWQKEEYIDAHYNAQVMYDELDKLIPLSFGYEVFKKHYNNTRV